MNNQLLSACGVLYVCWLDSAGLVEESTVRDMALPDAAGISDLFLSCRAREALRRGKFNRLSELTQDTLSEVRNCGVATIAEIMEFKTRCMNAGELIIGKTKPRNKPRKPVLMWSDVPPEHRLADKRPHEMPPDDLRCKAASRTAYTATKTSIPRCPHPAKENGLCFLHLKIMRENGS